MTYQGYIKNGVAVLDEPADLPDGTRVRIEVERADAEFWKNKDIQSLAHEQGVVAFQGSGDLGGDWPEEDSIDEFLAFIREARH